ncbi:Glycosyltransferase Family 33 protein [Glomus cerebriforme]|uniref:Chitobiosyldiphosphodolichol beta-mannosyltransferase n=1 Tax=Glomus cerebriforme TaxID=658196 RepID=A0A397S9A9_9GLOM|nr:Glycosyltransferase Family 33 protein [Glomus cerebriforme]
MDVLEPSLKISDTKILIALLIFVILFRLLGIYFQNRSISIGLNASKNVTLVVLGDIGRSPRMQYHSLSFAQNGWTVDFVGYDGSTPLNSIIDNPKIKIHYISHPWRLPDNMPKMMFLLIAPIKVYSQILRLYWILLFRINRPDYVLVQNPPSIPTLMIVQFVCWLRSTKLIIDWHNFGYTILGLRLGHDSRIVKIAKWYEQLYGGRAHAHLTVTSAMHRELMYKWDVKGTIATLYDKPPTHFRRLTIDEIHEFLLRINLEKIISEQSIGSEFLSPSSTTSTSTLLTTKSSANNSAKYRHDRPILIVSSTSWTADEDFSMLLKAAQRCDQVAGKTLPKLLFVITGKGPLKEKYEKEISKMTLRHVRIITMWLSAEDYPLLLGSADLGVCLHTSSSGMDLPMKIVDMFGCGLPVCAVGFECLGELVRHNKNGLIFNSGEQLAEQLIELFTNYPTNTTKFEKMRNNVSEFQKERWDTNWNRKVLPLLDS